MISYSDTQRDDEFRVINTLFWVFRKPDSILAGICRNETKGIRQQQQKNPSVSERTHHWGSVFLLRLLFPEAQWKIPLGGVARQEGLFAFLRDEREGRD
ncbi:hypothetical protein TNCV_5062561 [Trichonephila clavipes]|nr:hypothetical protein TNCV_5062561 [Trichonephila clavipes]